ncbi:MAG: hypothetical protein EF813_07820 [Methanosarcinales archaeon]|nr:MAG: hypothetical protein EF813_07820 [Methanosarcinales archaeon]
MVDTPRINRENTTRKQILGVLGIAFVCGVVVQLVQIIICDTTGIDRILGDLTVVLLILVPIHVAIIASHYYHKDWRYMVITGMVTMVFAKAALNMYAIG